MTKFEKLKRKTRNTSILWKHARGIAPDCVADKLDISNLDMLAQMTDTLEIWINKGNGMTKGELLLAVTNLGSVVESWLKFFYCVYYEDYTKSRIAEGKHIADPEKASFINLINFSKGKLWDDKNDPKCIWVDTMRERRNAIHIYQYRDIGTTADFLINVERLYDFVEHILLRLPPLEDCMDEYPKGYVSVWD